jgi:c-di-GMP-binding flagellar brake protein YcgR
MNEETEYQLTSGIEISHMLRLIHGNQSLILLQPPNRVFSGVTALLDIDASSGALTFDALQEPDFNRRLVSAGKMLCDTSLDQIRVYFTVPKPRIVQYQGHPALVTRMPDLMNYVQQRDSFRVELADSWNINCLVDIPGAGPREFKVRDISSTGMNLTDNDHSLDTSSRYLYTGRLNLSASGVLDVKFRVLRHKDESLQGRQFIRTRHVGCTFEDMHQSLSIRIQGFVNMAQRDQIARERGML